MPVVRSHAGRFVVFSSPPLSPSLSPVSSPPRLPIFNDGFPADQAAEYEVNPEDEPEDPEAKPANADDVEEEARSSDGDDDGADLDDFVVLPGAPISQGSSSVAEESAVFSQPTQSSLGGDAHALEDDPDGDYVPPGVHHAGDHAGDEDDDDGDDGDEVVEGDNAVEDDVSENEDVVAFFADLGDDDAFLNFLDNDDAEVEEAAIANVDFDNLDFKIEDDGDDGGPIDDGAEPIDGPIIMSDDEDGDDEDGTGQARAIVAARDLRSPVPFSDDCDFVITAVKRKQSFVQGTGGPSFPMFVKKPKASL